MSASLATSPRVLGRRSAARQSLAPYRPFGGTLTQPTSPALHIGFTGHDRTTADTGLNLVYMNARYYMPGTGRFLSADTLIPDPADSQAFNRYSYVYNNPIKFTDPTGHCVFAPPYDTLVCIALIAMALRGDSRQPPQILLDQASQFKLVAEKRGIDPIVLAAVVTHESQALERRLAGLPEAAQIALVSPERLPFTSIGPAQMQLRTAEMLENLGYIAKQPNMNARIDALLDTETAIDYAGAYLQYLGERISAWYSGRGYSLSQDVLNRLSIVAYNIGWGDPYSNFDMLDQLRTSTNIIGTTEMLLSYGYLNKQVFTHDNIMMIEQILGISYGK